VAQRERLLRPTSQCNAHAQEQDEALPGNPLSFAGFKSCGRSQPGDSRAIPHRGDEMTQNGLAVAFRVSNGDTPVRIEVDSTMPP
jgi:hypothetical protein